MKIEDIMNRNKLPIKLKKSIQYFVSIFFFANFYTSVGLIVLSNIINAVVTKGTPKPTNKV